MEKIKDFNRDLSNSKCEYYTIDSHFSLESIPTILNTALSRGERISNLAISNFEKYEDSYSNIFSTLEEFNNFFNGMVVPYIRDFSFDSVGANYSYYLDFNFPNQIISIGTRVGLNSNINSAQIIYDIEQSLKKKIK